MKRRTIITSVLVIVLCLGLISGSTFALFTSTSSVNIAVTSGKVNVVASLDALKLYSADATLTEGDKVDKINPLDKTGTIKPTDPQGAFAGTYYYRDQTSAKEFLNGGTAKIETNTETSTQSLSIQKITPGDKVAVNVNITNNSNVAIQYRVRVNVLSGLKLYEGLVVKVDGLSLKGVQKVSNWTYKTIPANETEKTIATIPVEVYLPLDAGNEYQDLSTSMQITVEAVQGNANTTNEVLAQAVNAEVAVSDTTVDAVIKDANELVTVTVPAAGISSSTTSLEVNVVPQDTVSTINITSLQESLSYDVEVVVTETVTANEQTTTKKYEDTNNPVTIKLFVGTGLTGVKLYHNADKITNFTYDSTTGYITFQTGSFSEYTVVYNKDIAVEKNNTITVYTPTEDDSVYEDAEGNVVQITVDDKKELVIDTDGVAYIAKSTGTFFYDTLAEAIQAAAEGETIVMAKDSTSVPGYEINKIISLDTNGKTITVTEGANVSNRAFKVTSGKLTVYGGGTIDAKGAATSTTGTEGTGCYGAFRAEVGTELSLSDLTLKNYRPNGLNVKVMGANATLDNVKIVSVCGGGIEVTDDKGCDGTIPGYAKLTNCTMTQSDYRDHCSAPLSVSGKSKLDVYSTEYVGEYGVYVFSSGGTINIYGGSYKATSQDVLMTSYDANYGNDAIINVYDGTFVGTIKNVSALVKEFINIYGGTFDNNPTAYVPTTGYVVNYANEKYTVQSELSILADQLKAAGYKDVSINENEKYVLGTFTDDVVYRFYSLEESYVEDPKNYNGFAGNDVEIDTTVYYVGKLVPVTGIVQSGFANQSTITKLVITRELTDTFKALSGNTTITTVEYVKGVTTVTSRFFYDSMVSSVTLPESITKIEDWAFYASRITSLVVPEACTYIGYKAFDGCTTITTLDIKGSPVIYNWAGRGATNLKTIIIRGANANVDLVHAPSNQPVGDYVFNNVGQTTNPHYNDGMKIYVANSTVGSLFAKEIYAGADVVVMENPTTFIPNN